MKSIKKIFSFNKSCLLCKYKYDKDACFDATYNHGFKCRSLSNIYYGKLVKWFPFNVVEKIKDIIEEKKAEKFYADFNEEGTENSTMKHIFGVPIVPSNLMTMNDLDVTYYKDENKYVLGVETLLGFSDQHGKYDYVRYLLDEFTKFMNKNGYDTSRELALHEVFTFGFNINTHYDSIEECYAAFKMLVNGFCSLEKGE